MRWPAPHDYNEVIQNPAICFSDEGLKLGKVEMTALGLPRSRTGAFASVYKVTEPSGSWAVRCFLTSRAEREERYERISEFILFDDLESTVDFYYLEKGIRIRGDWYPILKMKWVDGVNLDQYILENYLEREKMRRLLNQFYEMVCDLRRAGIAHGDLQHGNILVTDDGLRLVDYDAFYIPALKGRKSLEIGHPNFQHPDRNEHVFDNEMDNFSAWLIYLSISIVLADPNCLDALKGADDCILLRRHDLTHPDNSKAFQTLLNYQIPEVRRAASLLMRMLWASPHSIPAIDADESLLETLPSIQPENQRTTAVEVGIFTPPSLRNRYADLSEDDRQRSEQTARRRSWLAASVNPGKVADKVTDIVKDKSSIIFRNSAPVTWGRWKIKTGNAAFDRGDYDLALACYMDAHKVFEKEQVVKQLSNLQFRLAATYALSGNLSMAQNYYLVASKLEGKGDLYLGKEMLKASFLLARIRHLRNPSYQILVEWRGLKDLPKHIKWIISSELANSHIKDPEVFRLLVKLGETLLFAGVIEQGNQVFVAAEVLFDELGEAKPPDLYKIYAEMQIHFGMTYVVTINDTISRATYNWHKKELVTAASRFATAKHVAEKFPELAILSLKAAILTESINYLKGGDFSRQAVDKIAKILSAHDLAVLCETIVQFDSTSLRSLTTAPINEASISIRARHDRDRADTIIALLWQIWAREKDFETVEWLEKHHVTTINKCLQMYPFSDSVLFERAIKSLITSAIKQTAMRTLVAFVEIVERQPVSQPLSGYIALSLSTKWTSLEMASFASYVPRDCTKFFREFTSGKKPELYKSLLGMLLVLCDQSASTKFTNITSAEQMRPNLTSFDLILDTLCVDVENRNVSRIVRDLLARGRPTALIASILRLAIVDRIESVSLLTLEFSRNGHRTTNLGDIMSSLAAQKSYGSIKAIARLFTQQARSQHMILYANHCARDGNADALRSIVDGIISVDETTSLQRQRTALQEIVALLLVSEDDGHLRIILERIADANLSSSLVTLIPQKPSKTRAQLLTVVIDHLCTYCPPDTLADLFGRLIRLEDEEVSECAINSLLRRKDPAVIEQTATVLSSQKDYLSASLLWYKLLTASSNGLHQDFVQQLSTVQFSKTLQWIFYWICAMDDENMRTKLLNAASNFDSTDEDGRSVRRQVELLHKLSQTKTNNRDKPSIGSWQKSLQQLKL